MTWRIGRRGAILMTVAMIQLIIGSAIFEAPPETMKLMFMLNFLTPQVWGTAWMVAAAVAIPCAFLPSGRDKYGFVIMIPIPLWWSSAIIAAGLTGWPMGAFPTIRLAAFYGGYGILALITSGMVGFRDLRRGGT